MHIKGKLKIGVIILTGVILIGLNSCTSNNPDENGGNEDNRDYYTLTIKKTGDGDGYIKVNGEEVSVPYSQDFEKGSQVEVSASADWSSEFVSWGGSVNSSDRTLTLNMTQDYNLVAYFISSNENTYTVTVQKSGSGASGGYVYSLPGGISCGNDCVGEYGENDTVKIIAVVTSSDVVFDGFAGDTLRTLADTAFVVANNNKTVIANFRSTQVTTYTLSVSKLGLGTVTSNPPGISCGLDCSEDYESGTSVTLTAVPEPGYLFSHWSGAVNDSSPTCVITMDAPKSVVANFIEQPPIFFDHFDTDPFSNGWSYGPGTPSNSTIGYSNSMIYPNSYGNGSGWYGPEIIHDLDTTINLSTDNFEASAYIVGMTNQSDEEGLVRIDLLDAYNSTVVAFMWYDNSGWSSGYLQIYFPDGDYYSRSGYASFNGVLGVRKQGDTYTLFINDGEGIYSYAVSSTRQIKRIRVKFEKYGDILPASTLKVDWVKVRWLPH